MKKTEKQHALIEEIFYQLSDCESGSLYLSDEKENKTALFTFTKKKFEPRWTTSAKEAMEHYTIKSPDTLAKKRKAGLIKSKPFGALKFKYWLE